MLQSEKYEGRFLPVGGTNVLSITPMWSSIVPSRIAVACWAFIWMDMLGWDFLPADIMREVPTRREGVVEKGCRWRRHSSVGLPRAVVGLRALHCDCKAGKER